MVSTPSSSGATGLASSPSRGRSTCSSSLVQKDRLPICEISISRITHQYLDYLRSLEALNVEIAGEFLVMAATLMRIKSRQLLPTPEVLQGDEDLPPLTREDLIQRLLEFRRYKQAASSLRLMEEQRRRCHPRGSTTTLPKDHLYPLRETRVTDLMQYLREVMTRDAEAPPTHDVHLEEIRLEEQIERLVERLRSSNGPVRFHDLIEKSWWRLEWIVTFLAMLELVREGRIEVLQEIPFGELLLVAIDCGLRRNEGPIEHAAAPEVLSVEDCTP